MIIKGKTEDRDPNSSCVPKEQIDRIIVVGGSWFNGTLRRIIRAPKKKHCPRAPTFDRYLEHEGLTFCPRLNAPIGTQFEKWKV